MGQTPIPSLTRVKQREFVLIFYERECWRGRPTAARSLLWDTFFLYGRVPQWVVEHTKLTFERALDDHRLSYIPHRSALDVLMSSLNQVVTPRPGKPLTLVCEPCGEAFLYPTRALDEYVSSPGGHAVEPSAHKVAARLRKSGNTQHRYMHSSGIAVGTCNRCGVRARAPAKKRPQAVSPCESTSHTGSADAPAKYAPQASILHLLWTGPDANTERLPSEQAKKGVRWMPYFSSEAAGGG